MLTPDGDVIEVRFVFKVTDDGADGGAPSVGLVTIMEE